MITKLRALWAAVRLKTCSHAEYLELLRESGVQIGSGCRILHRFSPSEPWLIRIGNHVTITAGVRIITHDGGVWVGREADPYLNRYGRVDIRDNVFIGVGATILPGTQIGPNAIVAAGSVVSKDVPANSVVGGVPARVLMTVEDYLERVRAESLPVGESERARIDAGEDPTTVMEQQIKAAFPWPPAER